MVASSYHHKGLSAEWCNFVQRPPASAVARDFVSSIHASSFLISRPTHTQPVCFLQTRPSHDPSEDLLAAKTRTLADPKARNGATLGGRAAKMPNMAMLSHQQRPPHPARDCHCSKRLLQFCYSSAAPIPAKKRKKRQKRTGATNCNAFIFLITNSWREKFLPCCNETFGDVRKGKNSLVISGTAANWVSFPFNVSYSSCP